MKRIILYILNALSVLSVIGILAFIGITCRDVMTVGFGDAMTNNALFLVPFVLVIPILFFRQKLDHELNYDEFGMNKKSGKFKRKLSGTEQRNIDLQQIYDLERILGKDTLKKMTQKGSKNPDADLDKVIGLENVKAQVLKMSARMEFDRKHKEAKNVSGHHMCFFGNPGTGKTTVARIMTGILYKNKCIAENRIIEIDGNFLKASNPTDTAMKTQLIIRAAEGGVLFIDEAYALIEDGSGCGTEAVATLIKQMEDKRDKFVLIIAGYTDPINRLLDSNPGFKSRIKDYFTFMDYNDEELLDIFVNMAEDHGFDISSQAVDALMVRIKKERKSPTFGNARTMRTILDECIDNHAVNTKLGKSKSDRCLQYIDIEQGTRSDTEMNVVTNSGKKKYELNRDSLYLELDSLIGLQSVKERVRVIESFVNYTEGLRKDNPSFPAPNYHMAFLGNPGVGKTTVARIMGQLLFCIGLLPKATFIECSRQDLVGHVQGETAEKTAKMVEKAKGGVLFIDEAYSLWSGPGDTYGEECVSTLIKLMEDWRDDIVVIFAGYTLEMGDFMESNSGLASRIGQKVEFPDYTAEELADIYIDKISKYGLRITDNTYRKIIPIMENARHLPNFGNGRYADHMAQETVMRLANRHDTEKIVKEEDVVPV